MAISTSGLTVPQLSGGGGVDASWLASQQKPQQMSLSDMVNTARSAQQFRKEQELFQSDVAKGKAASQRIRLGN
jgi:hypothetical protein